MEAKKPSADRWTFKHFKPHVAGIAKLTSESWKDYRDRVVSDLADYDEAKQGRFLDNAIEKKKTAETSKVRAPTTAKKPKLWSKAYVYRNDGWHQATFKSSGKASDRRTRTSHHEEQVLFSTMGLPTAEEPGWIGFAQNEFPCIDLCCPYFKNVSLRPDVLGVVFAVVDSGDYARDHGLEPGASGHVYFYKGVMSHDAPPGVENVPAPPPTK